MVDSKSYFSLNLNKSYRNKKILVPEHRPKRMYLFWIIPIPI
ncbi:hypothetical protein DGo_PA0113 (plasmid) [Deinococcus gobiensis I-0]|uniref:Uncharacterized protein n=1 Tax=Deinococcus gobiensis (strain DSM 21396 / JCM 16679 / CGMCC 1.7299 / I-0) TaxID=745776 RepID=H8H0Y0_DEIGI|nr:hypothetical protein DGo_PA0113 [Deinococcus gobiensis I-0]